MGKKDNGGKHHAKDAKVLRCRCKHAFQDERHGIGLRVHNPHKNGMKCTVCGDVKLNP